MDRPLTIFKDGSLYMLDAGQYRPKPLFHVVMMREAMLLRDGPEAERYVRECQAAINQYNAAMEEARCDPVKP